MKLLRQFKNIALFAAILGLLIVLQFKNHSLSNLRGEVSDMNKVEIVYEHKTDTVVVYNPVPVEVVKWKTNVDTITEYVPIEVIKRDTVTVYEKYTEQKLYDNVLRDDSTGYIRIKEVVQFNSIVKRELFFTPRVGIVHYTTHKQDKTFSIVGGIGANIGLKSSSLNLGLGVVTNSNRVYVINYDPVNKGFGGSVYFPIFNIRR